MKKTVYDKMSGRILYTVDTQGFDSPNATEDEIEGTFEGDYFCVVGGRPVPRLEYSLDNIPLPAFVCIEGVRYRATTQPEFTFGAPGAYKILVLPDDPRFKEIEFDYIAQP